MNTKTINISVPSLLYKAVGEQAKNEARTKSGLIQEAIRYYLAQKNGWRSVFDYAQKQVKKTKFSEKDVEKLVDEYR